MNYTIRKMLRSDIEPITKAFVPMNKTRDQYERYFAENQAGESHVQKEHERADIVAGYPDGQSETFDPCLRLWTSEEGQVAANPDDRGGPPVEPIPT